MPLLLEPGPSGHSGMCARKRERVKHCVCDESTKTLLISMNKLPVDRTHTHWMTHSPFRALSSHQMIHINEL